MDSKDRTTFPTPKQFASIHLIGDTPDAVVGDYASLIEGYLSLFLLEVERRAEENMLKTGRLEGSHFAAMTQLRKEVLDED